MALLLGARPDVLTEELKMKRRPTKPTYYAAYFSMARWGTNDISLHATRLEALDSIARN